MDKGHLRYCITVTELLYDFKKKVLRFSKEVREEQQRWFCLEAKTYGEQLQELAVSSLMKRRTGDGMVAV